MIASSSTGSVNARWKEAGGEVLEIRADNGSSGRSRWSVSEDGKALTLTTLSGPGAGQSQTLTKQ